MKRGDVVGGRFELERLAGTGGMGTVWQGRDLSDGRAAAVKLLDGDTPAAFQRFAREASVLASLEHPGIVRYLGHGEGDGARWLAMEWLEGEDVAERLAQKGLTVRESVRLLRCVCEPLALAHARGVVHRDIKPSNLFLVERNLARVKVLDFGVARIGVATRAVTMAGVLVGTPGYMAPEQARAEPNVDARADVFSLGCLLYECLTGRPAFSGEHVVAVLAKILLEEAPRALELVAVSTELDELCARMLSKDRAARPSDAAAVLDELDRLGAVDELPDRAAGPSVRPPALGGGEQRFVSVLFVEGEAAAAPLATLADAEGPGLVSTVVAAHDARLDALADGTLVVTLDEERGADVVARGAACAWSLRALWPERRMALGTGRAELGARLPLGDAIDRAARLFRRASPGAVAVDDLTAALLEARYEIAAGVLGAPRPQHATRTLLGKPTPCVGRDAELALLDATLSACIDEPRARAVVITAAAGVGKSRLRYELLQHVRSRAEPVEVWIGRGEPVGAGSALGIVAEMLRRAADIREGEPIELRQAKLRARIARHVPPLDVARVTEFLCEVVGAQVADAEASVFLRSARADALIMGDQVRRAWIDLVGAEAQATPFLLVLEDLQWGDAPSVSLADEALRLCPERPIMVLALGRLETLERFPALFEGRDVHHLRLGALPRRPAERLVRAVLGSDVTGERVAEIVERAAGNAFFLEELVRATAEGRGERAPESVLAVLEMRLAAMEPEARRVLRAASVFGQVFWAGGVRRLCGTQISADTDGWLAELEKREVVARRSSGRLAGEVELVFRHSLVRDAAYALLTGDDRALGHRLAAEWLELAGERDAALLAHHFEEGDRPEPARRWLSRAAEQALEANDYLRAVSHAERAADLGAEGEELGRLRLLAAEAHKWRGAWAEVVRTAHEAIALCTEGDDAWCDAVAALGRASGHLGRPAELVEAAERLVAHVAGGPRYARNAALLARMLFFVGRYDLAESLLERASQEQSGDALARARVSSARAVRAAHEGDPAGHLAHELDALVAFEAGGDKRAACTTRAHIGYAYLELGAHGEAESVLREALAEAQRMGLATVAAGCANNLGAALAHLGRIDEARRVESEAVSAFAAQGDRRLEGASRVYLAEILLLAGDLAGAEAEARAAVALLEVVPPLRPFALAALAEVLLAQRRPHDALGPAREAAATLEALGRVEEGEALVRLAHARALEATADREGACRAIAAARVRLRERAAKVSDPARRESFLANVPEHARTLAHAREWLGDAD